VGVTGGQLQPTLGRFPNLTEIKLIGEVTLESPEELAQVVWEAGRLEVLDLRELSIYTLEVESFIKKLSELFAKDGRKLLTLGEERPIGAGSATVDVRGGGDSPGRRPHPDKC
jgi:hypothetical protein